MSFFDELKASLEDAIAIKNGSIQPGRVTRYTPGEVKAIRAQRATEPFAKHNGESAGDQQQYHKPRHKPIP